MAFQAAPVSRETGWYVRTFKRNAELLVTFQSRKAHPRPSQLSTGKGGDLFATPPFRGVEAECGKLIGEEQQITSCSRTAANLASAAASCVLGND